MSPVLSFALSFALLATVSVGCGGKGVCSGVQLTAATTSPAEASAMEELWRRCAPLSMSAYDASGARLSFSSSTWMDEVDSVDIRCHGGQPFKHTVVDAGNLSILMRE